MVDWSFQRWRATRHRWQTKRLILRTFWESIPWATRTPRNGWTCRPAAAEYHPSRRTWYMYDSLSVYYHLL